MMLQPLIARELKKLIERHFECTDFLPRIRIDSSDDSTIAGNKIIHECKRIDCTGKLDPRSPLIRCKSCLFEKLPLRSVKRGRIFGINRSTWKRKKRSACRLFLFREENVAVLENRDRKSPIDESCSLKTSNRSIIEFLIPLKDLGSDSFENELCMRRNTWV